MLFMSAWVEASRRGVMTSHANVVYSSPPMGKTWSNIGLEKIRQISKIVVHPIIPDVLIVSARKPL